jgi:HK97 family phage major capsid protein
LWSEGLIAGQPDRLLGYPVAYSESMPAITTDSLSIAFGDFARAYTVIRRLGVKLLSEPYTDKPNVRLYGYQRVGGGVSNSEAIKFLKFGDS